MAPDSIGRPAPAPSPAPRRARAARGLAVLAVAATAAACGGTSSSGGSGTADTSGSSFSTALPASAGKSCPRRVVAAGDMNGLTPTKATGTVAQGLRPDVVAALGDEQYPDGALSDFRAKYDRTGWGQLKARTRPVPGNHEYHTPGARGYFVYFGNPPKYYAYDLGCGWRGYALNSEVDIAGQAAWLRRDLAAHSGSAVLAYWHRPRYSSGTEHGDEADVQPFWDALAGRTTVVLNGHEHNYERFALKGTVREFVVGTGGSSTYPFRSTLSAGSVKRMTRTPGVLVLELGPGNRYSWRFRDVHNAVLDSGSG